jgi:pimeloyl-ACP methyl ester carboxylesterase
MLRKERIAMAQAQGRYDPREQLLSGLPVSERRLYLGGVSTFIWEGGEGPPMVLLHGPGEHAAKWIRLIPLLVGRYRVVAPDLPGHGSSEVAAPLDRERVLAWLGALLARTCAGRVTLVGQILGGAIAARFAIEHGELLERLVLADALGLAPFQPAPQFGAALAGFLAKPSGETHDALWERCAFDLAALRAGLGERWDWLKAYNLDRAQAPGLASVQRKLMEQFGMPAIEPSELARIRVPATLIWGRHDLAIPLAVAQAASARYGWPLHIIDNAGDDPPLEQPEAFARALG